MADLKSKSCVFALFLKSVALFVEALHCSSRRKEKKKREGWKERHLISRRSLAVI